MRGHREPFDPAYAGQTFISAKEGYDAARAVIYGMPMDWTTSFRPGTRLGPRRIREVSLGLEEYSPYLDRSLLDASFVDMGDIPLPFGNPERSLTMIEQYVGQWLDDGKFPLGLGGEHLVTLGVVRAVAKRIPEIVIVHVDAHTDLRDQYEGELLSHSAVIKKIAGFVDPVNIYQFGIRSGTREEFAWAKEHTNFHPFDVLEPLRGCLAQLEGRPIYVTVDIDVLDPAHAPGTGTAEAGGISSKELLAAIHAMKGLNVVGFDLVEVAPVLDASEQTQIVAAKVVREALLAFAD
ncbi:agmatinase [Ferroacidibacillus organovorans]|uniref:Agmatinase n=1 Tax=Ferroacidibacillus organovorans TaxID=1765683 RepID=A0A162TYV8_9BACL|nr:agmatinase [Ferroacidibacillus organovorans]KYP81256.1 agmatinase [Ferroacidibacillus organovorans]OAG93764.1 agmatinase [Ferroacidibacillus organovorans]OPG16831.1 agmatinase [Ferroacidibacillus organovorans]